MSDGFAQSSTLVGMSGDAPASRRLRDVPAMLGRAVRLLWRADHRTFVTVATLQIVAGGGIAVQLLVGARVLRAILDAGASRSSLGDVLPELATLAVVTAVLGFATSALA